MKKDDELLIDFYSKFILVILFYWSKKLQLFIEFFYIFGMKIKF